MSVPSATNQEVFDQLNALNEAMQEVRNTTKGSAEQKHWSGIYNRCWAWLSVRQIAIHLHASGEWRFGDWFGR